MTNGTVSNETVLFFVFVDPTLTRPGLFFFYRRSSWRSWRMREVGLFSGDGMKWMV